MSFCLIPSEADKFLVKLKDGSINPEKLSEMTSAERRAFFADFMNAENAKEVNALFESKLLLKDQQAGMISWAKKVSGITPEVRRDLFSRINKLENVLDPGAQEAFLEDLAAKRLGVEITQEEAKNISELSQKVQDAKATMEKGGNRLEHGAAKVALKNYVRDIKLESQKTPLSEKLKTPLVSSVAGISKLAGLAKSFKATLDNSFIGRQALPVLFTDPVIWAKNFAKSFETIGKTLKGQEAVDAIEADILSRPNAMNGRYEKAKLAIGNVEEAFPESLPEKIPLLGRIFKASEAAYKGTAYRLRADLFDKYIKMAEQNGVKVDDRFQLESWGRVVNSLTGRGSLGKYEGKVARLANNMFFSPRAVIANWDILTAHAGEQVSPEARKKAATNMLKIIIGMGLTLALAKRIDENSVETDLTSADSGKIKVGSTRFDISGGKAGLLQLATRLITRKMKSTATGKSSILGEGFGSKNGWNLALDFVSNKLSPSGQLIKELFNQQDSKGNTLTPGRALNDFFTPLPITNIQELLADPNSANLILSVIADGLGISTNTYSPKKK